VTGRRALRKPRSATPARSAEHVISPIPALLPRQRASKAKISVFFLVCKKVMHLFCVFCNTYIFKQQCLKIISNTFLTQTIFWRCRQNKTDKKSQRSVSNECFWSGRQKYVKWKSWLGGWQATHNYFTVNAGVAASCRVTRSVSNNNTVTIISDLW